MLPPWLPGCAVERVEGSFFTRADEDRLARDRGDMRESAAGIEHPDEPRREQNRCDHAKAS